MNSMPPVTEADLHAWVDGLLAPARRAEIDAHLRERPEEARRLRAYQQQNADLRALFDPVLDAAVPARLATPPARAWPWRRFAAGLLIACASGAAGWQLRGAGEAPLLAARAPAGLAHRAAIAHAVYSPEVRHPVEVGAEQEAHLVAWLSKRLGAPLRPPRLGTLGYALMGGRLLPGNSGPVAQFMYQDGAGRRLTLYVTTETGEAAQRRDSAFRYAREGRLAVFYWIDGTYGYALSAAIDKDELAGVAAAVYAQLEPR
ncbi:MAG TPA: hypothetical protein DCW29_04590 [Janthinobacterium sp.]|nr:hypothetical protein [Janthinobacterium sp.]